MPMLLLLKPLRKKRQRNKLSSRRLRPRLKLPRKNKTDLKLKLLHPRTLMKNTDLKRRPRKLRRLKSKRS